MGSSPVAKPPPATVLDAPKIAPAKPAPTLVKAPVVKSPTKSAPALEKPSPPPKAPIVKSPNPPPPPSEEAQLRPVSATMPSAAAKTPQGPAVETILAKAKADAQRALKKKK